MSTHSAERRRPSSVVVQPRFVVQAVGWIVLGMTALLVIDRSRHVLALMLLSTVIAVLLRAPIEALSRNVPRWAAVTIVVLGSLVALGGLLALGTIELNRQIDSVGDTITDRIEQVDPDSQLGQFLADGNVAERINDQLDRLPSQVLFGSSSASGGAQLGLEALLVVVLVLYTLINGPVLARAALGGQSPHWWAKYVREGVGAGATQVRRLLGLAVVSGLIAFATASVFGLPGTTVLAIWVGVWTVVPIFGPVVGYAPMIVLASIDGWPQAAAITVIAIAVAVGSWFADQRGLSPSRIGGGARLGPLGLAVALVIGLRFGWLTGPVVAIFLMAATVSAAAALGRRDRARLLADHPIDTTETGDAHTSRLPGTNVWGRLVWSSTARATLIAVLAVAAIVFLIDLAPVPVWIVVGITLSIALDPLVERIADKTPLGRGAAIAAVIAALLTLVVAMLVFALPSVVSNAQELDDQLPQIASDLERLPLVGGYLADHGVAERLQNTIEDLPDQLASDTSPLEGALRSVGDGLIAMFWVLLITVAALVDGRRVRRGLRTLFADERHDEFDRVDGIANRVIARYAVGSVVIAIIAGSAAFTIAVIGGVPLAALIGLWAALTNFIPQVGGYLGAAPLIVLGFTTGTTKGLVIAAAYLVYMQIENRVIQPLIVSRAVDISPLVAMVAVLIGSAAAGVVGAVLVTPLVAVATSLRREFRSARPEHGTSAVVDRDVVPR